MPFGRYEGASSCPGIGWTTAGISGARFRPEVDSVGITAQSDQKPVFPFERQQESRGDDADGQVQEPCAEHMRIARRKPDELLYQQTGEESGEIKTLHGGSGQFGPESADSDAQQKERQQAERAPYAENIGEARGELRFDKHSCAGDQQPDSPPAERRAGTVHVERCDRSENQEKSGQIPVNRIGKQVDFPYFSELARAVCAGCDVLDQKIERPDANHRQQQPACAATGCSA